jgi:hypothetical protein
MRVERLANEARWAKNRTHRIKIPHSEILASGFSENSCYFSIALIFKKWRRSLLSGDTALARSVNLAGTI